MRGVLVIRKVTEEHRAREERNEVVGAAPDLLELFSSPGWCLRCVSGVFLLPFSAELEVTVKDDFRRR